MPTRLWDAQAALATMFTAVAGTATVFAGPRPRSGSAPREFILVGSDGDDTGVESIEDGLVANQALSSLGPGTWRDETGSVTCSVWAWSGNSSITTSRAAAKALLAACEQAVATDRTLGGLLTPPGLAETTVVSIRESQTDKGPVVRVVFTVSYSALLT